MATTFRNPNYHQVVSPEELSEFYSTMRPTVVWIRVPYELIPLDGEESDNMSEEEFHQEGSEESDNVSEEEYHQEGSDVSEEEYHQEGSDVSEEGSNSTDTEEEQLGCIASRRGHHPANISKHFFTASGFTFDPKGSIITCSHPFEDDIENSQRAVVDLDNIQVRYGDKHKGFVRARLCFQMPDYDFAILHPTEPCGRSMPFASIAPSSSIKIGLQALAIGNPGSMAFSLGTGHIAHHKRSKKDLINLKDNSPCSIYNSSMRLIQLNNIHMKSGASGCPIFNSSGLVMGLFLCSETDNIDLGSHCKDLRKLARQEREKNAYSDFWETEDSKSYKAMLYADKKDMCPRNDQDVQVSEDDSDSADVQDVAQGKEVKAEHSDGAN